MFQQIIGTIRRTDLLSLHHVGLSRLFTISIPRDGKIWELVSPEARRRKYNYFGEKYKTDEAFRTRQQLRMSAYRRAQRALLSEDEKHQYTLLECFRRSVTRRLKQGRLPHWENHVPEFVDESVVCNCTSCGRIHYKGRAKIWWKSKSDGGHEVSTEKAI